MKSNENHLECVHIFEHRIQRGFLVVVLLTQHELAEIDAAPHHLGEIDRCGPTFGVERRNDGGDRFERHERARSRF